MAGFRFISDSFQYKKLDQKLSNIVNKIYLFAKIVIINAFELRDCMMHHNYIASNFFSMQTLECS